MGEYAIFNVCVSAAVVLLTATYTTLYYVLLKKKGFAIVTPARVTCVVLAVAIALIGFENTLFIDKEIETRRSNYCKVNEFAVENIYGENSNGESIVSPFLSVYGQYYKSDSIPGYKKQEKTNGDIKYTYYIEQGHNYDTNDYTICPNLIIFAEYIGGDKIPGFIWSNISAKWISNKNVEDENAWLGTWKSNVIMIYGRFGYDIDSINFKFSFASSDTSRNNGSDILNIVVS